MLLILGAILASCGEDAPHVRTGIWTFTAAKSLPKSSAPSIGGKRPLTLHLKSDGSFSLEPLAVRGEWRSSGAILRLHPFKVNKKFDELQSQSEQLGGKRHGLRMVLVEKDELQWRLESQNPKSPAFWTFVRTSDGE